MSPKVSTRLLAAQSDRRLLDLVAAGHERAFEVLVQRYRGELLRYCRRLGLSESRAEDAVQQGLLRAWLALERGDDVRELRAWMYRIVHNTAVNIMRRAPEDHSPLTDAASVESAAGAEVDLERTIAVRDALTDVAALPPMQREAILLTAVDGRSHDEVASALGITHGAVRGLIYRARATLRGAAAALTPQPLISWLYGGAAKVTPTAQRIAELSAQGGGGSAPGTIFRGAALAVTAVVLVAGAAEVPLHHHAAHHAKASSRPVHLAMRSAGAQASSFTTTDAVVHVTTRKAGAHRLRAVGGTQLYANSAPSPRSGSHQQHITAPHRSAIAPAGGEPVTAGPSAGTTVVQSPPSATLASST
ncbi:MAG TPA: sigma-70 family RNA polymerase sigma factor, partial [Solirubrobacteraceae bacterium]|nr:sigma-70 family RNA polymerase sigma factor [Solirubrobacteraceae bacterium]